MNSLDPRSKRFRAADRSLQQARNALNGAVLALQDIPHSNISPLAAAMDSITAALEAMDSAAGHIDEARLAAGEDDAG